MDKSTLKRVPFRVEHHAPYAEVWIDPRFTEHITPHMPGVITAREDDVETDESVKVAHFMCRIDPLAESPEAAIQALTDYLDNAIWLTHPPTSGLPDLLADGDTNPPAPIPQDA